MGAFTIYYLDSREVLCLNLHSPFAYFLLSGPTTVNFFFAGIRTVAASLKLHTHSVTQSINNKE